MVTKDFQRSDVDAFDATWPGVMTLEREVARIDDPGFLEGQVPGHIARHLISGKDPAFTDPFLVLAEDWMPSGTFDMHPHRGIETVTLVLEGSIQHHDTAGNRGVIHSGDAQWMTVGRGVRHQEDPPERTTARVLQLWINLPASQKMTEPRYQDLRANSIPVRRLPGIEARVFSGQSGNVISPTLNHVPVTMIDARIDAGFSFHQDLAAFDNAFIYVVEGEIGVGNDSTSVSSGQLAWLSRSDKGINSHVIATAIERPARILLLAGRPLREPVVFGGPFVMNTPEEIQLAFSDFRAGRL